jgi:hypothetical protein
MRMRNPHQADPETTLLLRGLDDDLAGRCGCRDMVDHAVLGEAATRLLLSQADEEERKELVKRLACKVLLGGINRRIDRIDW